MRTIFGRAISIDGKPYGHLLTSQSVSVSTDGRDFAVRWHQYPSYTCIKDFLIIKPASHEAWQIVQGNLVPTHEMRKLCEQERIERLQQVIARQGVDERMPKPPSGHVV